MSKSDSGRGCETWRRRPSRMTLAVFWTWGGVEKIVLRIKPSICSRYFMVELSVTTPMTWLACTRLSGLFSITTAPLMQSTTTPIAQVGKTLGASTPVLLPRIFHHQLTNHHASLLTWLHLWSLCLRTYPSCNCLRNVSMAPHRTKMSHSITFFGLGVPRPVSAHLSQWKLHWD